MLGGAASAAAARGTRASIGVSRGMAGLLSVRACGATGYLASSRASDQRRLESRPPSTRSSASIKPPSHSWSAASSSPGRPSWPSVATTAPRLSISAARWSPGAGRSVTPSRRTSGAPLPERGGPYDCPGESMDLPALTLLRACRDWLSVWVAHAPDGSYRVVLTINDPYASLADAERMADSFQQWLDHVRRRGTYDLRRASEGAECRRAMTRRSNDAD